MLAQAQGHIQATQRVGILAKVFQALFLVTERDLGSHFHKLLDAALVADARTDKGNFFAPDQFLQLFNGQHFASLPCC